MEQRKRILSSTHQESKRRQNCWRESLNGMGEKEESSEGLPGGGSGRCAASVESTMIPPRQSGVETRPWAAGAAATHTRNGCHSVGCFYYCCAGLGWAGGSGARLNTSAPERGEKPLNSLKSSHICQEPRALGTEKCALKILPALQWPATTPPA